VVISWIVKLVLLLSYMGMLDGDHGLTVIKTGNSLFLLYWLSILQYMYIRDLYPIFPSVLGTFSGVCLLFSMCSLIVWASGKYSSESKLPVTSWSVLVPGLALVRVISELSFVLIWMTAVVIRCRNCAWLVSSPLMVISVGSVLVMSTYSFTCCATLMISFMVKNSSIMGMLFVDHVFRVVRLGSCLLVLYLLSMRLYRYSWELKLVLPRLVVMVAGACWLFSMYVLMFCASCRYSFCVSVPLVMVSVPVPGRATFKRGIGLLSLLLIFNVVVVRRCRNVAWLTRIPLTLMYSGRYLVVSRKFLTSVAVLIMSWLVMVVLVVSFIGI